LWSMPKTRWLARYSILKSYSSTRKLFCRARLIKGANSGRAASTDTTATAISYAGYFLLKYPQTWKTLCEEVRREFASVEEITQGRLSSLPYLNAVIQEGKPQIDPSNRSLANEASSSVWPATSSP
jgi:hypothetical protein